MTERLIDVGGYRLAVRITGSDAPPVVCLCCNGGDHEEWAGFALLMEKTTTVVTCGRPALCGSDPLPSDQAEIVHGPRWAAEQLRVLLNRAGLAPPYVLVTSSIGAFIADQYAAIWPDEVAGMVLDDPTNLRHFPGVDEEPDVLLDGDELGGMRLSWSMSFDEQRERAPRNRNGRFVVLSSAVGRWLRNPPRQWHQPLTLDEVDAHWVVMQQEWVQRLDAVHMIADTAGHLIHEEEPTLAAVVVRAVVDAAREGRQVVLDADILAAVGAQLVSQ